jgi:pyridoxal 5'-phosphate synthase pdxT subunit
MFGVLGLQGDYAAHAAMLEKAGAACRTVKKPEQLEGLKGLILPGGESTTLIKLMDLYGFWEPLRQFAQSGGAMLGTCAGMILLAQKVSNPDQPSLGLIDIDVERNSYGRQIDSFEGQGEFGGEPLPMIFIRAPRIVRLGDGVEALAHCRDDVVVARQDKVVVASFHPELTNDLHVHRYFISLG